jgi:hypothetical protein
VKLSRIFIALSILLIPLAARSLWFYYGYYRPAPAFSTPDFTKYTLPFPTLSTPIPTPSQVTQNSQVVLFDQKHANLFTFAEIKPFTDEIQLLGAEWKVFENDSELSQSLKQANSFVVIAPSISFTPDEINAVDEFVKRGGHLLVITDPTRNYGFFDPTSTSSSSSSLSSTAISNLLLNPFDISFAEDYLYNLSKNEGNFRHIIFSGFAKNPIVAGLKEIVLYSAHSIHTSEISLVTGDTNTYSSITDAGGDLTAVASSKDGRVTAIGDLTFFLPPYSQVADNQKFIQNLASSLVVTDRLVELADFPYLFSRDVSVIHDESVEITRDFISQIAELQNLLKPKGLSLELADAPQDGSDLLVVATFPPSEDIEPLLKDFEIDFSVEEDTTPEATNSDAANQNKEAAKTPSPTVEPEPTATKPNESRVEASATPDSSSTPTADDEIQSFDGFDEPSSGGTMSIPGFGKVPTTGLGLILFQHSEKQNKLIFMAESQESVIELLGRVKTGDLSGCLVKGNIALCGSTSNNGFSG